MVYTGIRVSTVCVIADVMTGLVYGLKIGRVWTAVVHLILGRPPSCLTTQELGQVLFVCDAWSQNTRGGSGGTTADV